MEGKDINQLIEAYLEGDLDEAERVWLEQEMKQDPELAELVEGLRQERRIEDYLAGKLSESEREDFEGELEKDETLKQAWEDYHLVRGAVEIKQRESYRDMLEEIDKRKRGPSSRSGRSWWWLGIIALVLIAITGYLNWYSSPVNDPVENMPLTNDPAPEPEPESPLQEAVPEPSQQINEEEKRPQANSNPSQEGPGQETPINNTRLLQDRLAAANTARFPYGEFSKMGGGLSTAINRAYQEYDAGRDSEVIELLNPQTDSLVAQQDLRTIILLVAAMVNQGQYEAALSLLEDDQINFAISELSSPAYWYRLLSLLHLERYSEARQLISGVRNRLDDPYYEWVGEIEELIPGE